MAHSSVNVISNYSYTVLESEVRIKAIVEGYDPAIGIIHEGRDGSLKVLFELIDPKRPGIDQSGSFFDPTDFTIRSDGVVRLNPQVLRRVAGLAATLLRFLTLS